jgi:DNA-binding HxlR family transcriptional regulator
LCPHGRRGGLNEPDDIDASAHAAIAALTRHMAVHGKSRNGPVRSLSAYVGDRWSTLILLVLDTGTWRHAALRRVLGEISHEGAISQRVLTLKLRSLERDGLVHRDTTTDTPPRVSYRLTSNGQGLVGEIRGLLGWIEDHSADVVAARCRFDARET